MDDGGRSCISTAWASHGVGNVIIYDTPICKRRRPGRSLSIQYQEYGRAS